MSKELKNITENIMDQIREEKIKMHSKIYFAIGSFLTFIGLVSSVIVSIFLVGLVRFSLRAHGPMAEYRLDQIISNFPWWAVIVAIAGLIAGIWLLRRYDFSYKIDFKIIILGFILTVIIGGWVIDIIGLNDLLVRRGPMQGIMKQYLNDSDIRSGPGWNRNR
jgi:hypothetical protein